MGMVILNQDQCQMLSKYFESQSTSKWIELLSSHYWHTFQRLHTNLQSIFARAFSNSRPSRRLLLSASCFLKYCINNELSSRLSGLMYSSLIMDFRCLQITINMNLHSTYRTYSLSSAILTWISWCLLNGGPLACGGEPACQRSDENISWSSGSDNVNTWVHVGGNCCQQETLIPGLHIYQRYWWCEWCWAIRHQWSKLSQLFTRISRLRWAWATIPIHSFQLSQSNVFNMWWFI